MSLEFTRFHYQILWVVGAFERLATLGLIEEVPLGVSADSVELFVELDEIRNQLITDEEIKELVPYLVQETADDVVSDEDVDCLVKLILEFKNNRTEVVKYGLNITSSDD
jgi:hypothetical protein